MDPLYVVISVPTTFNVESGKSYTAYQVEVKSECGPHSTKWTVTKRYNDFGDVRDSLMKHHKKISDFDFPAKQILNRFDPKLIEYRRSSFERFLRSCAEHEDVINDPTMKKFLQINTGQTISAKRATVPISSPSTPTLNTSSSNLNKQAHNSVAVMQSAKPATSSTTVARDQVVAVYDFNGETNFDLSFKTGDSIGVLEKQGEWWKGELNGKVGYFPANYVRAADNQASRRSSEQAPTPSLTQAPSSTSEGPPDFLAVAMYDFVGSKDQMEISFNLGDIIGLYAEECADKEEWWQGYVLTEDSNKLYGGYFPRIYVRRLTKDDFVYDDESGAYYYKTDITNYNYDAHTDTWIPIGGTTSTPAPKEEPKKTVEPARPPSQSVSISDSAHRRMSIIATGHMSMQLQTMFQQQEKDQPNAQPSRATTTIRLQRPKTRPPPPPQH
eukprot:TRINITY_DN1934_c0_g2_i1.p1 TRINITY_DN1934_c0_g2~~TRINITY_DN1934_c0_g2_i1.p1  ORF type:complete len:451 (-),score=115.05 TRINITY_DN1934_c0_g2_i1:95-1417(-)